MSAALSNTAASVVLAYLPSPDRGVWYLGPIPIRAYAIFIIIGIVVAVLWGERRFVARGGAPGTVIDIGVYAVPFGLVGGRLYHVATDWHTYFGPGGNPIDALKIWQGGLGIWGAIALGAVGAWIGCRRRGVPLPFFADVVAPGIVVAQAIGRLGNWFNQELYGDPTTLPWGLEIYRRVDPATGAPDPLGGVALDHTPIEIVQPTFLYELIWNLLVACLVVWADRRFRLGHGRAFAVYVAGYTLGRFFIEQMRSDPATRVFGDLRINVVVAAVVFVGAVFYLVLMRKPREVLTGPAAASTVDAPSGPPELVTASVGAAAASVGASVAAPGSSGGSGVGTSVREGIEPSAAEPEPASAEPPSAAEEPAPEPVADPADGADAEAAEKAAPESAAPESAAPEPAAPEPAAPEPAATPTGGDATSVPEVTVDPTGEPGPEDAGKPSP